MPNTLSVIASELNKTSEFPVEKSQLQDLFESNRTDALDAEELQLANKVFTELPLPLIQKVVFDAAIPIDEVAELLTISGAENDTIQDWINEKAS